MDILSISYSVSSEAQFDVFRHFFFNLFCLDDPVIGSSYCISLTQFFFLKRDA